MYRITTMEELHEELIKIGLIETTFEELSKCEKYSVKNDKDPRWKLKFRIYRKGSFFCVIFMKNDRLHGFNTYGGYFPDDTEYLICKTVKWYDDSVKQNERKTKEESFRYSPVMSENGKLCISDTKHTLTQAAENIIKGQDYWSYYDYMAMTLAVTASGSCIGSEAHDSKEFYYHYHLNNRAGGRSFYGNSYYKENCKEITTMEKLHKELIKIGLIETTFEELSKCEKYSVKSDKDPRWKLKFRIYRKGSFFCVIFMKNDRLHSFNTYGGYFPNDTEYLICHCVEWHNDRKDDVEY